MAETVHPPSLLTVVEVDLLSPDPLQLQRVLDGSTSMRTREDNRDSRIVVGDGSRQALAAGNAELVPALKEPEWKATRNSGDTEPVRFSRSALCCLAPGCRIASASEEYLAKYLATPSAS